MDYNINMQPALINEFEQLRNLLTTYAYNILGTYEDAKDIVQEAYFKFSKANTVNIENKKAYMVRTVINMSINLKNRQKKLIAVYPGEWLPEPVATESADTQINRKEVLSYSLMVLLEKLNAKQRAVFILKEAFDYDHKEIAEVLDINEENSRKLFSRAKLELKNPGSVTSQNINNDYLNKYLDAIGNADIDKLENLLKQDITIISDGGGKASAALQPLFGKLPAAKFLHGIFRKFYSNESVHIKQCNINHNPALLYYQDDVLSNCQVFEFEQGLVSKIYFIRNPDKLKSLQSYFPLNKNY